MTTKIIDLTQPGGSAGEFEKGAVGWFWEKEGSSLCYGLYGGISYGRHRYVYFSKHEGETWNHFSPTLPEWAKVEPKKPIELVKYIGIHELEVARMEAKEYEIVERNETNYFGFDLIKCTDYSGCVALFFGHWNDGVV